MIRASMPIQMIVQVYPLHSNKAALVTGPQYNIPLLTVMDEVDQQIFWTISTFAYLTQGYPLPADKVHLVCRNVHNNRKLLITEFLHDNIRPT